MTKNNYKSKASFGKSVFLSIFLFSAVSVLVLPLVFLALSGKNVGASANATATCTTNISVNAGDTVLWDSNASGNPDFIVEWSGDDGLSGDEVVVEWTYDTAGSKTGSVLVTATGNNDEEDAFCDIEATIIDSTPTPSVTLTANPEEIEEGESSTLSWESENTVSCSSDDFETNGETSGSVEVSPTETTTYNITCVDDSDTEVSDSTTVTVTEDDSPPSEDVECEFEPQEDRIIVNFNPEDYRLRSNGSEASGDHFTGPVFVNIGSGKYKVSLMSHDEDTEVQDFEQWHVILKNDQDETVAQSEPISDLPDGDSPRILVEVVDNELVVSEDVSGILAWHSWFPNNETGATSPNSVDAVCAAFDKLEEDSTPSPSVTLTANPEEIEKGESSTLSWKSENTVSCSSDDFETNGETSGSVEVSPTETTTYNITCVDDSDTEVSDSATVIVDGVPPSNNPPAITLLGDNPLNITLGNEFVEPGYEAFDEEDGDLTDEVVVTGDVDTSTLGEYTLSYDVSDSEGLPAPTKTRTVNVVSPPSGGGGGGGGGGGSSSGGGQVLGETAEELEIFNERISQLIPKVAYVEWNTNLEATSRVFYGKESISDSELGLSSENYGYEFSTVELSDPLRDEHGLGIFDLEPGVVYYFRPVSTREGMVAVGEELSFVIPGECFYLEDYLKIGWNNDPAEVRKLQAFLKVFEGIDVEVNGTFDQQTFNAVSIFQERYKSDILTPWGHTSATGFVYILTKKKVNEIYCQKEFPLTPAQEREIDDFRSYLLGLLSGKGDSGASSGKVSLDPGQSSANNEVATDEISDSDEGNIYDDVAIGGIKDIESDIKDTGVFKNFAASAVAAPESFSQALQCLIILALILAIAYVLSNILVSEESSKGLSDRSVRIRKLWVGSITLIAAIAGSIIFSIPCVLLPLMLSLLVLLVILLWNSIKQGSNKSRPINTQIKF